jgi:hypothetical protein
MVKLAQQQPAHANCFGLARAPFPLCKGVCEYALGQGNVGDIALSEGEEDARLIDDTQRLPRTPSFEEMVTLGGESWRRRRER